MKKIIKLIFILAVILTFVVPKSKKIEASTETKETPKIEENFNFIYYLNKGSIACISDDYLDSFISSSINDDTSSMVALVRSGVCFVNKDKIKITIKSRGFLKTEFLKNGIKYITNNNYVSYTRGKSK